MIESAPNVHDVKASGTASILRYPSELPATFESLVLPVDKPQGWSSFDVVRKLRRLFAVRKIGHAGTLDPMATGLLICLVGRATKQMVRFMEMPKTYTGTIRLGQTTTTYDAEGDVVEERSWTDVDDVRLDHARLQFIGDIEQQTPMYSAVKVGGERLYRKARRGETVDRPPRHVSVYDFTLTGRRGADVDFVVSCSRGTYIRAIAHDMGQLLGCGAHLAALRRTAIGEVRVEDAWTIAALELVRENRHGEGA